MYRCFQRVSVRVLKTKSGRDVAEAFESILSEGRIPEKLQTDRGKEFFNRHFQEVVGVNNIQHFATGSELKASVVERFNRTLKARMWRYLTAVNSKRYCDILPDLVSSYNRSYHRSIKMRPIDVSKENEDVVFKNLYGAKSIAKEVPFKFKPGDLVRVSMVRGVFSKGYEQNYTHEFFSVTECVPRNPPVYKLKDYDGVLLEGTFYAEELQKIRVNKDKAFKVEKILERKKVGRRNMVLVKWLGWPSKFNSWVSAKDVVDI